MTHSALLIAAPLVARFEGLRLAPYKDSVGVATVGYGSTYYEDGTPVTMADPPITEAHATALLTSTLAKTALRVDELLPFFTARDNARAALYSFAYNLGVGALAGSTLLKKLRAGDAAGAAAEFVKWNHAGGVVVAGLTKRRQVEAALFLRDTDPDASQALLNQIGETLCPS